MPESVAAVSPAALETRVDLAVDVLSHPGMATAAEAIALALLTGEITPPTEDGKGSDVGA